LNVGNPSSKNLLERPWLLQDETAFLKRVQARGKDMQSWALAALHSARAETAALTEQALAIERQIDQMVYGLYGLAEAEIAVIEGSRMDVASGSDEAS